jgi:transposase
MLDGDADGEEQLALRGEQVHLRLGRDDLVDRLAQQLARLTEETSGADPALVAQLAALPKTTRSMPSSSFADLVTLPLSTRGSAISRL